MCSPAIFASKLSVQLLRGTEKTCRYVDRCGYEQTKNNLFSKKASDGESVDFLHKPFAGSLNCTAFPRRWVPLVPLETFLQKTKGKVLDQKSDRAWSKKPDNNFSCEREKLTCSYKMIRIEKEKGDQKAFVYLS